MNEFKIRSVTAEDLPALAEIERDCIPQPWSLRAFETEFAADSSLLFCAEDKNGVIVGFVTASYVLDEVSVNNVAVTGAYRGKGIGTLLMNALQDSVSDFASFITLEVRESNASAIALYEKCGFGRVGVRKNFYENPREDAVLMTSFLK